MKTFLKRTNPIRKAQDAGSNLPTAALAAMFLLMPASAWAQDAIGETGAVCKFFSNINNILNIASIAVVTIAVIFAGYQIAFAHKRISDVAPVLIGGLLIGGAAQFAKMLMPNQESKCLGDMAMFVHATLQPLYA
jgi:type IV secretion system protein VirB2